MSPEDLSQRHPRLFHVTLPGAPASILQHGLLSTSRLLDRFEVTSSERERLERMRRPTAIPLHHPTAGTATLNDQSPMSEAALARCLDDGLAPRDWLALINRRVFFWSDERGLATLLGARANRTRAVTVLVVDTLGLVRAHADRVELSPINSGSTIRKPARRGRSTFTALQAMSYEAWRRQRGGLDRVVEVTVLDGVPDIVRHIVEVRHVERPELSPRSSPPAAPASS